MATSLGAWAQPRSESFRAHPPPSPPQLLGEDLTCSSCLQKLENWLNNLLAFAVQKEAEHPIALALLAEFLKVDPNVSRPISAAAAGSQITSPRSLRVLSAEDMRLQYETAAEVDKLIAEDPAARQARQYAQHHKDAHWRDSPQTEKER
eukprot:COSAG01_NODE_13811_length_1532_cov_1.205862_1_plen_148_part_10